MTTHRPRTAIKAAALGAAATLTLMGCAHTSEHSVKDPIVQRPAPDSAQATDLARSINDAGFAVFHAALKDGQNTTVSPLSIGLAFGMLDAGASGSVETALDNFFHFPGTGDARLAAFNTLEQKVSLDASAYPKPSQDEPGHATVTLANRLFIDDAFTPLETYRTTLARYFGAGAQNEPLATDGKRSANDINSWVKDKTQGLIPQLLDASFFNDQSKLTLVNTLYMHADWATPFDPNATAKAPFTLQDGSTADVDMMNASHRFGTAAQGDGYVAVTLPYAYDELDMVLIVPDSDSFAAVQGALSQDWLDNYDATATQTEYNLALPKFTTEGSLDLRQAMEAAGANGVYDQVGLDGIGPDLSVSGAIHATKVIVDEKGTEAAAATAIGIVGSAMPSDPPLEIRADHPFLYVIRDHDTGAVLFVGRVLDPR